MRVSGVSGSAFHADDLLELGHDFHEVVLLGHHLIDVFVGLRSLVDDA